jgi:cell division protein FtsB
MTVAATGRRRFQFSLRSILIVTALTAILLVPVAWVARERQQMIQARQEVLRARQEAIHAVVLAERAAHREAIADTTKTGPDSRQSAKTDPHAALIEQLQRENAVLKAQVKTLRQEVERLRAAYRRGNL